MDGLANGSTRPEARVRDRRLYGGCAPGAGIPWIGASSSVRSARRVGCFGFHHLGPTPHVHVRADRASRSIGQNVSRRGRKSGAASPLRICRRLRQASDPVAPARLAIGGQSETGKSRKHHRPGRRFGDRCQASEQAIAFAIGTGGKVERTEASASRRAIAEPQAPKAVDRERISVGPVERADPRAGGGVVGVDPSRCRNFRPEDRR